MLLLRLFQKGFSVPLILHTKTHFLFVGYLFLVTTVYKNTIIYFSVTAEHEDVTSDDDDMKGNLI